ncbi:MAG: hypothetical protein Q7R57_05035 [Dehalococcoidales bacterium]|nr:hypothetical protein [Dehalococcoidales bacterium]
MVLRGKIQVSEDAADVLRQTVKPAGRSMPILEPFSREEITANVPTRQVEALAAVFDLSGYTSFCSQADPPAVIPAFLDGFLQWLFVNIEKSSTGQPLWREPPFFAKFLGDGVLLLWDTGNMVDSQIAGLIATLSGLGHLYRNEFYPKLNNIGGAPQSLRCRIARGSVFSVNNGRDYVGHCINLAVHLQEYRLLSLCIACVGLNAECLNFPLAAQLMRLSVPVKGIKTNQSVLVIKKEVEALKAHPA